MKTPSRILSYVLCIVLFTVAPSGEENDVCRPDRIHLNLFKVRIKDNRRINDVKEFLSTHGLRYNGPIVSVFHSFILQKYTVPSACPVARSLLSGIQHEEIVSIDQDFQRRIYHRVSSSVANRYGKRLMQAETSGQHSNSSLHENTRKHRLRLKQTGYGTSGRHTNHFQNASRQSSWRALASVDRSNGRDERKRMIIAVVDNGFQMDHPNLVHAINQTMSYDFLNDDPDPSENSGLKDYDFHANRYLFIGASHSTVNLGIIAGLAGNGCSQGIKPNIQLVAIQIIGLGAIASDTAEAKALTHLACEIGIVSASYGMKDNTGFTDIMEAAKEALRVGVEKGRDCKGRLFVYPSGNGHYDNSNMDGYAKSVYTLTITDVGQHLTPLDNKERGPCILAATIVNDKIKRPGIDSTCIDGNEGSSYAVPVGAAYMADMLEVNENLTKRDVEHIVIRTATQEGFNSAVQWKTNAAGFKYNDRVGFGLMNPQKMKTMAEHWSGVPDVIQSDIPVDDNSVTMKNSSSEIRHLEHVEVDLELCCSSCYEKYFGMLSIDVRSPIGTVSSLLTRSKFHKPFDKIREHRCINWVFMTYEFWGESPIGPWNVSWNSNGEEGLSVTSRKLILRGTKTDPTNWREEPKKCPKVSHDEDLPASGSKTMHWILKTFILFVSPPISILLVPLGCYVLWKILSRLTRSTRLVPT